MAPGNTRLLLLLSLFPNLIAAFQTTRHLCPLCTARFASVPSGALPVKYEVEKLECFFNEKANRVLLLQRVLGLSNDVFRLFGSISLDILWHSVLSSARGDNQDDVSSWAQRAGPRIRQTFERSGPTFVKFGQALASRGDLLGCDLAEQLLPLQDCITPFDDSIARRVLEEELPAASPWRDEILATAFECTSGGDKKMGVSSGGPAAAASVSQVYRATIRNGTVAVAVKVQRPVEQGRLLVATDAILLRRAAQILERLDLDWWNKILLQGNERPKHRLFKAEAVAGVDEFMSRLFEEMDFQNERSNLQLFETTYGSKESSVHDASKVTSADSPAKRMSLVKVPKCFPELCSDRVLVMEWIDGEKLMDGGGGLEEDFALVKEGIQCTLSQLLETGIMHADPHGGNLLKVERRPAEETHPPHRRVRDRLRRRFVDPYQGRYPDSSSSAQPVGTSYQLAYLDFGLVSRVPVSVRDGIVAAVVLLVDRRYTAVAELFGDLLLLPPRVMEDKEELASFCTSLEATATRILSFEEGSNDVTAAAEGGKREVTRLPVLRFDRLLSELLSLAPRFEFQLPPYFLNNARALGTLEGMAVSVDPSFSVMKVVYPFALRRLLTNPDSSPRLRSTLDTLVHDETNDSKSRHTVKNVEQTTGKQKRRRIRWRALGVLLDDASQLLGVKRRTLLKEVLAERAGRRFAVSLLAEQLSLWIFPPRVSKNHRH